jgi:hypothetical protein
LRIEVVHTGCKNKKEEKLMCYQPNKCFVAEKRNCHKIFIGQGWAMILAKRPYH